jgi:hypothetical protein
VAVIEIGVGQTRTRAAAWSQDGTQEVMAPGVAVPLSGAGPPARVGARVALLLARLHRLQAGSSDRFPGLAFELGRPSA